MLTNAQKRELERGSGAGLALLRRMFAFRVAVLAIALTTAGSEALADAALDGAADRHGKARGAPRPRADRMSRRFVSAARELIGVRYRFGGRMRGPNDGIDCQGVLFYAAERAGRCSWKSFSVFPTRSVVNGELGRRVAGLDPVASEVLDAARLAPGDVLLLVGPMANSAEPAIAALNGRPVWVWHTGLYSGNGNWIVGDHYAGRVVETNLREYLHEHRDMYSGVFVTRMTALGPAPPTCRTGDRMRLQGR